LSTNPIYIYSHLLIYIYLQLRTGPFYLFINIYFFIMHGSCLFNYIIKWFNIEIKFMINEDLIIVVGGMTLGI